MNKLTREEYKKLIIKPNQVWVCSEEDVIFSAKPEGHHIYSDIDHDRIVADACPDCGAMLYSFLPNCTEECCDNGCEHYQSEDL